MKLVTMLTLCGALLFVDAGAAQRTAADPLTGTWTGTMGPSDQQQQSIKVELKYDGKRITGVITGPRYPGDIVTGTFDSKTGALTFDVIVQDEAKTKVIFEGRLTEGTARGTVAFDGQKGTFSITKDAVGKSPAR